MLKVTDNKKMDNTSPSKTLSKQQRIWQVISQIPEGNVLSYKGVALQAGMVPQAARLVGLVLKQLPKDTKLPWHRVVNSQGKISLPAHSAAYREQKQRLLSEGIVFNKEKNPAGPFPPITSMNASPRVRKT